MKKLSLAILVLVLMGLFAFADYYRNIPEGIPRPTPNLPSTLQNQDDPNLQQVTTHPNITKQIIDLGGLDGKYQIEKRVRTTELFERYDLSQIANISIYRNILIDSDLKGKLPIYVYEIHAPTRQGGIIYLNTKLAIIEQNGTSAGINESGNYGYTSLFLNNKGEESTGFLLSQVEDIVFGFQYDKNTDEAFDFVKSLVNNYMSQFSNNS